MDLFVIERMFVRFAGAYTTDESRQGLRMQIEASGPFFNKRTGDEYTFVTRAMSGMVHEYQLDTSTFRNMLDTRLYCLSFLGFLGLWR